MNKRKVKQYMRGVACEHVDYETCELNCTTLAEDACQHFNLYSGFEIPEELFDWAFEISEEV